MKKIFLAVLSFFAFAVHAMEMPNELKGKTVTLISHSVAGGWNDVLARTIAKKVEEQTELKIVVVNRPGASGNIGAKFVQASEPNGLTLCHCDAQSLVYNPVTGMEGSLRPGDLEGITLMRESPLALIVSHSSEVSNVNQLLELHKKRGLVLSTIGTQITFYGVQLAAFAGDHKNELTIVPYKGDPENAVAVAQGNADYTFVGLNTALNLEQAKKVKIIGITSATRMPTLGKYPTIKESVDMVEFGWSGIFAPKGVPENLKTYYNTVFSAAVRSVDFSNFLAERGGIAISTTPKQTDSYWTTQFNNTNSVYMKNKHIFDKK